MCSGIPDYILSKSVFSLDVSIEATMLYMLNCALSNGGEWPEFLYAYNWFPRELVKLGESKRLARWNYLIAQEPRDTGAEAGRHSFWMRGYAENKVNVKKF